MKVMRAVTIPLVPETTKEVVSHVLCDLCGARGDPGYLGEVDWGRDDAGDTIETTVMLKVGYDSAEGGHWDTESFHMCGDCFRGKLVPWLKGRDVKPSDDEIDW